MKIACLGWGSLIWDPRDLPLRGMWFKDGPILPIEFARESSDKRITLVITGVGYTVRTLWALMAVDTLDEAKHSLAKREDIEVKNIRYSIGFWERASDSSYGKPVLDISDWAKNLELDAVVWTNLKCGFRTERGKMPEYGQVLEHIAQLSHEERRVAEEYVRRTPVQIDTEFRRKLQTDLGWMPIVHEKAM